MKTLRALVLSAALAAFGVGGAHAADTVRIIKAASVGAAGLTLAFGDTDPGLEVPSGRLVPGSKLSTLSRNTPRRVAPLSR